MARPKSSILSGMGAGWEIIKALIHEVTALGGNEGSVQSILKNKALLRQIAELIVAVTRVTETFSNMIELGVYDYVNPNITESKFSMSIPHLGSDPRLYHFGRATSTENAIKEMSKDGYRSATIWDLLDYGAKNFEMQERFRIAALGSVCEVNSFHYAVFFYGDDSERNLGIALFSKDWGAEYSFLAVRK